MAPINTHISNRRRPFVRRGKTLELDTDHTYNNKNSEYKQPKQIEKALVTY